MRWSVKLIVIFIQGHNPSALNDRWQPDNCTYQTDCAALASCSCCYSAHRLQHWVGCSSQHNHQSSHHLLQLSFPPMMVQLPFCRCLTWTAADICRFEIVLTVKIKWVYYLWDRKYKISSKLKRMKYLHRWISKVTWNRDNEKWKNKFFLSEFLKWRILMQL